MRVRMPQTNLQIITDSFRKIGVVADGKQPSATQTANALTILNDMLASENVDGMRLGWYPQTLAMMGNNAPLRDQDIGDVKFMLAERLCIDYAKQLDPVKDAILISEIAEAKRRLTKRSIKIVESDLGELSRPQGGPWGGPNWL